jgi:Uncharacterized protein involved in methicillin resistance
LPFKNLRIPVAILRGPTRANNSSPGTLLVAGDEHRIEYMSHRFFESEPHCERLSKVPLWNLDRTLKRLQTSADLTVVCVDKLSARLFFGADYLIVPEWTGLILTVPEDPWRLDRSSRSLKEDLRVVRRNNLTPGFTGATADFELFYHTMYVPFIVKRHGEQAVVRSIDQLRRRFYRGGLIWVLQGEQPIAGAVFQLSKQVLRLLVVGTINGDWSPVKSGALAALYLFIINHAKERGCKLVDLGGSRPSLNDGLLRYKRKWGAKLTENRDIYYDFLIRWNHLSRPVTSFLLNTPLIFRDKGGLSALCVIDQNETATQNDAWKAYRSMWIQGLQKLYLVSTSGWQPGINKPPQTHLADTTIIENCDFQKLG